MSEQDRTGFTVAVAADDAHLAETAQALAERLELPFIDEFSPETCAAANAVLCVTHTGLSLVRTGRAAPAPLRVDFGSGAMRHRRRGGQNELLGRAVGVGKRASLRVLDATAGLARDSFVLADLGCLVQLCERHPLIHALLADGLARARASDDPWLAGVAERLELVHGDASALSPHDIDVIYLDPMFPERSKQAAVKADLALLQDVLQEQQQDDDGGERPVGLAVAVDRVRVRPERCPIVLHFS